MLESYQNCGIAIVHASSQNYHNDELFADFIVHILILNYFHLVVFKSSGSSMT